MLRDLAMQAMKMDQQAQKPSTGSFAPGEWKPRPGGGIFPTKTGRQMPPGPPVRPSAGSHRTLPGPGTKPGRGPLPWERWRDKLLSSEWFRAGDTPPPYMLSVLDQRPALMRAIERTPDLLKVFQPFLGTQTPPIYVPEDR